MGDPATEMRLLASPPFSLPPHLHGNFLEGLVIRTNFVVYRNRDQFSPISTVATDSQLGDCPCSNVARY